MKNQLVNRNELDKNVAFLDICHTADKHIILLKVSSTYYHREYADVMELERDALDFLLESIGRLPMTTDTIVADCSISYMPRVQGVLKNSFKHVLKRHPRTYTTETIFRNIIKNR